MTEKNQPPEVYLDHAAATPLDPEVAAVMAPYMSDRYGNPSSIHLLGRQGRVAIGAARETVAKAVNAHADEIIFTPSGTASDNAALFGVARRAVGARPHIVASAIEHQAVLAPLTFLAERNEATVTLVPASRAGVVAVDDVLDAVTDATALVSVMYANNEVGTVQPIAEIGRQLLRLNKERAKQGKPPVLFHTDACQAAAYLPLDVEKLHVDVLTLNGGKLYGPKGTGVLFVRRGVALAPLVLGGGQEKGILSGTENVAGVVGLATALELTRSRRSTEGPRLAALRDRLAAGLQQEIPEVVVNATEAERLPNSLHLTILGSDGEALVMYLSEHGIYAGTGAACETGKGEPSHVLRALGFSDEEITGSLRLTLGRSTTEEAVARVIEVLPRIVQLLKS